MHRSAGACVSGWSSAGTVAPFFTGYPAEPDVEQDYACQGECGSSEIEESGGGAGTVVGPSQYYHHNEVYQKECGNYSGKHGVDLAFRLWNIRSVTRMACRGRNVVGLDVGAFRRIEIPCYQVVVDALACPGIDGRIVLLILSEFRCFPVGEALVL